uniref:Uncharacterized protein n=1 Tax=Fagus sylvatica TaxID=28930 RepID=A0A2N9J0F1_FAGSY
MVDLPGRVNDIALNHGGGFAVPNRQSGGGAGVMRSGPVVRRSRAWCWWTTRLRPADWRSEEQIGIFTALGVLITAGFTVGFVRWCWSHEIGAGGATKSCVVLVDHEIETGRLAV